MYGEITSLATLPPGPPTSCPPKKNITSIPIMESQMIRPPLFHPGQLSPTPIPICIIYRAIIPTPVSPDPQPTGFRHWYYSNNGGPNDFCGHHFYLGFFPTTSRRPPELLLFKQ